MCDGLPGACAQSFLPDDSALVHGNELLQEVDQTYPVTELRGVSKHTVDAVFKQLFSVDPPVGSPSTLSAADCFVGYLLLDALIGNGDRHHENWAVIHDAATRRLAPSYDHASSLGRELLDDARAIRLRGADRDRTVDRNRSGVRRGSETWIISIGCEFVIGDDRARGRNVIYVRGWTRSVSSPSSTLSGHAARGSSCRSARYSSRSRR